VEILILILCINLPSITASPWLSNEPKKIPINTFFTGNLVAKAIASICVLSPISAMKISINALNTS